MNRMLTPRKGIAALIACLVLGLGVAGVAGSAGSPTNEDLAKSGSAPAVARPSAKGASNEKVLKQQGLKSPRSTAARVSSSAKNDG